MGRVIRVRLEFDRSGRSNGQAQVHFGGKQDAILASDRFHNIPLDGLPMRIQVIAVPRASSGHPGRRADRPERWDHAGFDELQRQDRNGGGGGGPRGRSKVSAEMLDDDLDSYMMDRVRDTQ